MDKTNCFALWSFAHICLVACLFIYYLCTSNDTIFYDSIDESFDGRWIVSQKQDYQGAWKHAKSEGDDDYGLIVSESARKYAIVRELDTPITIKDETIVLQFETLLQNGAECGGAYLKYLGPQETGWKPEEFTNESPYTLMFGPDICGAATNKVRFILKHKNPMNGEYIEHHLKFPPSVGPSDKLIHVYTAILKPDNELRILVDGEEKKKVNFLSAQDFEPPLIPAKTIPDPDNKKLKDWDERANGVRPDDWDEASNMEIEVEDHIKPEGWLDDEHEMIADREDWDDEEDGELGSPNIDNSKYETSPGCAEWKRPMKNNPAYKGKWHASLVDDNPNYKGIRKPQPIQNPSYFELDKPNFEPIVAIGIEIWTMQYGILVDNILIASDEKVAESYREATWKFEAEKEKQKKVVFDLLYKIADIPFLSTYKPQIIDHIQQLEKAPEPTTGDHLILIIFIVVIRIIFCGKKNANVEKRARAPVASNNKSSMGESEQVNEEEENFRLIMIAQEATVKTKVEAVVASSNEGSDEEKEEVNEKEEIVDHLIMGSAQEVDMAMGEEDIIDGYEDRLISWKKPPSGWVKINTDGASKGSRGKAGAGGLIRDDEGRWLVGFSVYLGYYTNTTAELQAMRVGLLVAWEVGFRRVICETDAFDIIILVGRDKNETNVDGIGVLVKACRELIKRDWDVQICHTYREGNRCADALANLGVKRGAGVSIYQSPPDELTELIKEDMFGVALPRRVRV